MAYTMTPHASIETCWTCRRAATRLRRCTQCQIAKYCSKACEQKALPHHKQICHPVRSNFMTGQCVPDTRVDLEQTDWAYPLVLKRPVIGCDPPQRMCDLPPDTDVSEPVAMPPSCKECPVCLCTLPLDSKDQIYQSCCGKIICAGCIGEYSRTSGDGEPTCPMCRAPMVCSDLEHIKRLYRRAGWGDGEAVNRIGLYHQNGMCGFNENLSVAKDIYNHACRAGCSDSHINLAVLYHREDNLWRFCYHMKRAAILGNVNACFSIASMEYADGNISCAVKHWAIAARMGCQASYDNLIKTHSNQAHLLEPLLNDAELSEVHRDHNESVTELRLPHRDRRSVKGYRKVTMT